MIQSNSETSINAAVEAMKAGRPVIVTDDAARENEADLIMAAEAADESSLALFIRYTSGIICIPMQEARLRELSLDPMVVSNSDPFRTAFTVSVDYIHGTTTGVSAHDRAITIKALASHQSSVSGRGFRPAWPRLCAGVPSGWRVGESWAHGSGA